MLQVKGIDTFYGPSRILFGVDLEVGDNEVVSVLGRNGVGKTTLVKTIMGLLRARNGSIMFEGEELVGKPPDSIARLGFGYVPQGRRIFTKLTTQENLEVAAIRKKDTNTVWSLERIFELFPILKVRGKESAQHLSGGEQQMLAIGRALMTNPKLLLMDEPFEGLAPRVIEELTHKVIKLRETGLSIFLVEQNVTVAVEQSDRCYIIEKGQVCYQGPTKELIGDKQTTRRYLAV